MSLDSMIDSLNYPLFGAYFLIGILLVLSCLGVIGQASKEGRVGAGFLACILLPAGFTLIIPSEALAVITMSIRVLAAWGLIIWWLVTRGRSDEREP